MFCKSNWAFGYCKTSHAWKCISSFRLYTAYYQRQDLRRPACQVHLYRGMPLDLVIGERLVGCTLVPTRDGTPSRQILGPSDPQRSEKQCCVIGNVPAASVRRDTLVHNQNRNIPTNWWLIHFRWFAIWQWIEWECYKYEDSTKKSHSSIQAGDTL